MILLLAQCGNGVCESQLLENCVTCPYDCHGKTCGIHYYSFLIIFLNLFHFFFVLSLLMKCEQRFVEMEFVTSMRDVTLVGRIAKQAVVIIITNSIIQKSLIIIDY